MRGVRVDVGATTVVCAVAQSAEEQARGLQGRAELRAGEGMLFPFYPARSATFHMGKVAFPIDVIFADGSGRITSIVHAAQPGSTERWTQPVVGAVVELAGGAAATGGVRVGDRVAVAGRRLGVQTYNLLRTLTEASASSLEAPRGEDDDGFQVQGDPPPLMDGYYSKEPQHQPPDYGGARNEILEEDRWQDRDPFSDPNRMEQPNPHFEWDMGYSRPNSDDGTPIGPSVRMSAQRYEVSLPQFLPVMAEAAARAGIDYEPLALNERRERAVVTPQIIGSWLHTLGLPEHDRDQLFDVATSEPGLSRIGQALIAAELAETANITHYGAQNVLVLTRNKRG